MTRNEASSSGSNKGESVVVDVGRRRSSCGYCKSGRQTSISHGLWAHSLTVDHYQALLDRGWRRSGCFLYRPEMEKTCCPSYTIRLKASDFAPSKEQLRVSKKMQRFLEGSLDARRRDELSTSKGSSASEDEKKKNDADLIVDLLSNQIDIAARQFIESGEGPCSIQQPKASIKRVAPSKSKSLAVGSENLLFSSNISFQIAAAFRRAEQADCAKKNVPAPDISPKVIAEKVADLLNQLGGSSGLSIRACNGHINFYSAAKLDGSNQVVDKVTTSSESSVRSSTKGSCSMICDGPKGKGRRLEIRLKRSSFDPEEFSLYRKYQMQVHDDTEEHVTESSYKRFLVDSPLVYVPSTGDGTIPPCGFGSFHQQYVVDGRLVAVGVVDILPKCLSSKYLFWDPDFANLSLGKYSALQEIGWVKENQLNCPSLEYYYLGYYIHSCNKMRYKAAYRPSELLCPLRFQWVSFDIARPLLDRKSYVVLSDYSTLPSGESSVPPNALENNMDLEYDDPVQGNTNDVPIDEDEEIAEIDTDESDDDSELESYGPNPAQIEDGSVGDILIGLKGSRLRYKDLQGAFSSKERGYMESQLRRYMKVVGAELSEQMVYSLG